MATHPLTTTSNIILSKSHVVNTKNWHLSNIDMSTPLKSCESSYPGCSVIIINVIWKSAHSIITCHSPSSYNITISSHPGSLKSCVMAQIWMLHDNPSTVAISSSMSNHSLIMIHLSSCKAHLKSNHLGLYLVRSKKMMEGIDNDTVVC